jgi:hypothetical protein
MLRFATLLLFAACIAVPTQVFAKGPLAEPDEGPDPRGLTVSGSGLALLKKPSRLTEASIQRSIVAARPRALARAVDQARLRARELATAAGLTLGDVRAVTERDAAAELSYGSERHCFRARVRGVRRLRCRFPVMTAATVNVTFATSETSAAASTGRALVAVGSGRAAVTPLNRRSSASISRALLRARLAAMPPALADARQDAQSTARAAGMELGAVFSVAEVRRPFDDLAQGSFGPGRYCGTVRRAIVRRDPKTGRRRVLRTVQQRRCYFSSEVSTAIRVTVLAR